MQWDGTKRCDNIEVEAYDANNWIIKHPTMGIYTRCPCCNKPLITERTAKLVADAMFPPQLDIE